MNKQVVANGCQPSKADGMKRRYQRQAADEVAGHTEGG